jgi:hypothetical protein
MAMAIDADLEILDSYSRTVVSVVDRVGSVVVSLTVGRSGAGRPIGVQGAGSGVLHGALGPPGNPPGSGRLVWAFTQDTLYARS